MANHKKEYFTVKKNGKYMKGHSYTTLLGYSFKWTKDVKQCRLMEYGVAYNLSISSGGKVVSTHY